MHGLRSSLQNEQFAGLSILCPFQIDGRSSRRQSRRSACSGQARGVLLLGLHAPASEHEYLIIRQYKACLIFRGDRCLDHSGSERGTFACINQFHSLAPKLPADDGREPRHCS